MPRLLKSTFYYLFTNVFEPDYVTFNIDILHIDSSIELLDDMCKQPYVKKLYKEAYGKVIGFDDKEYSKNEMVLIIRELVERLDSMENSNFVGCAVMELGDFKK